MRRIKITGIGEGFFLGIADNDSACVEDTDGNIHTVEINKITFEGPEVR